MVVVGGGAVGCLGGGAGGAAVSEDSVDSWEVSVEGLMGSAVVSRDSVVSPTDPIVVYEDSMVDPVNSNVVPVFVSGDTGEVSENSVIVSEEPVFDSRSFLPSLDLPLSDLFITSCSFITIVLKYV